MEYEVLLNKILRIPQSKGVELLNEYQSKHKFKTFAEQQRVLDLLTIKTTQLDRLRKEFLYETMVILKMMAKRKNKITIEAYESIKHYPMIIWIEIIGSLEPQEIINLLRNFHDSLPTSLIETCIINLPDNEQAKIIKTYHKKIDCKSDFYYNFYYSVSPESEDVLDALFPDVVNEKLLLTIKDIKEEDLIDFLNDNICELKKYNEDEIIEAVLLKVTSCDVLAKFFKLFKDIIIKCSNPKFELLLKRYCYLPYANEDYGNEDRKVLSDLDLFEIFKEKFHDMGAFKTLKLFNNTKSYGLNKFSEEILLDFLDIAYEDDKLNDYINDATLTSMIQIYVEKCHEEEYTIEDLDTLIKNCGKKNKLIKDDYIKAIIACGSLLKKNIINDQHPLFIELRNLFNKYLFVHSIKDETVTEAINFNGLFYRLAKGTLPFEHVFLTRTYRGIIYLSKCGTLTTNADYITRFLTDEQILKMNISPLLSWKKNIKRMNTQADNISLFERMSLQLLLFFGREKAEYLMKYDMFGNRMESLFDGLNYKDIPIDEKGQSIINKDLNDYLFGLGKMNGHNTVINRMLRGEIMEFEKYFSEFCNNFYEIKNKCNGILSIKRILNQLSNVTLPIELKPDELHYETALKELNTTNEVILNEAINLLNKARKRKYSTIPKVKGEIGDFTYEMLDLNDPLNIAVGYLSHCCFKVQGISYSSLIQALTSFYGRIFVVYYKGSFLTQSWVWRNGDVVCFDSVESGSPVHGAYKDDIHLLAVYKQAAREILAYSQKREESSQAVKLVTVGRSDFIFDDELESVKGEVPRPIEKDTYISDSNRQKVLAGSEEKDIRYGYVGAKYFDPRRHPMIIEDVDNAGYDDIDNITLAIDSLRYQIKGTTEKLEFKNCQKLYCGDGWYIIIYKDNKVEKEILYDDDYTKKEYHNFLSRLDLEEECVGYHKALRPNIDRR